MIVDGMQGDGMTRVQITDAVLDAMYHAGKGGRVSFTRKSFVEFAFTMDIAELTLEDASHLLQEHRLHPDKRYVASCQSYGRGSKWRLLGVRGRPTAGRTDATREQAAHAARDMVRRHASELRYDVFESMLMNDDTRATMRRIYDSARGNWLALLDPYFTTEEIYGEVDELADPLLEIMAQARAR